MSPSFGPPFHPAYAVLALCVGLGLASPGHVRACPLQRQGQPSVAWDQAVQMLSASSLRDGDCAEIRLEVLEPRARLTFVTRDGRQTERQLGGPDELWSAVEALSVMGLPAPVPQLEAANGTPPATPPPAPAPTASAQPSAHVTQEGRDWSARFALTAGARAGAKSLSSPLLQVITSVVFRRWELGMLAAWELQYFKLRSHSQAQEGSGAAAFGVFAGRRQPLGRRAALLAGARMVVATHFPGLRSEAAASRPAASHPSTASGEVEASGSAGEQDQSDSANEWRLGAYLGVVLPRTKRVRLRVDAGFDLLGSNATGSAESTPRWAGCAAVGFEVGGS